MDRARHFCFEAVEKLTARIVGGEAVFFIGAGFSLDSEPNSSRRLIRRLVARFAAITEELAKTPGSQAMELREGLRLVFNLANEPLSSEAMVADAPIKGLASNYYSINDWICSAFGILLGELGCANRSVLAGIYGRENRLLKDSDEGPYVPLAPFDVDRFLSLQNQAGKALFLETMGFADPEMWGGTPFHPDDRLAVESYGVRLRDRHHVIARLAREGLAPLILTTNFDLLIEGAGRAAGFSLFSETAQHNGKPYASHDRMVAALPAEFFARGSALNAAVVLKIHGCVERYRRARRSVHQELARFLPAMVFTYREIQNWRQDAWVRDLLGTLLRTRSIVLCGYSGQDPAIHDTFRTVYEEILARRSPIEDLGGRSDDTRAFLTGHAVRPEFAGLELLRAGSRAAGIANPPTGLSPELSVVLLF